MNDELSSRAMKFGIARNGMLLIVMWTLHMTVPDDFFMPMALIESGFIASNIISIFENLHEMGIKIPFEIEKRLKIYKEETEEIEDET